MGMSRKRDSYGVTRELEAAMQKIGPVEFEYIFLKDIELKSCKGCFNCIGKGKELCPLKDDRDLIEEKMLQAEGVIFSSPGYVMNVSALMKNFIERFAYVFHRPKFFKPKALLISTGGQGTVSMALKYLTELQFAGFDITHKLGVTVMPWSPGQALKDKRAKDIKSAAEKYYTALSKEILEEPPLSKIISFNFFKNVAMDNKEYLPADYNFYKDLKEYYYPVRIGLFKRLLIALILKFSFFMMRDLGPEIKVNNVKQEVKMP